MPYKCHKWCVFNVVHIGRDPLCWVWRAVEQSVTVLPNSTELNRYDLFSSELSNKQHFKTLLLSTLSLPNNILHAYNAIRHILVWYFRSSIEHLLQVIYLCSTMYRCSHTFAATTNWNSLSLRSSFSRLIALPLRLIFILLSPPPTYYFI